MRGSPLRQLLGVALILLLTGMVVWNLTRPIPPAAPVAQPTASAPSESVDLQLILTTTGPAVVEFSPWNHGRARSELTDRISQTTKFSSGEKVEITFRVQWADKTRPQALRAVVEWDGEAIADQTFWGTGSTEDVLTFQVPQP